MEYLVSFGVILLFLISLIEQGSTAVDIPASDSSLPAEKGVLCYVCNSKGDPNCSDKQWNPRYIQVVNCTHQMYLNDRNEFGRQLLTKINKTQPNLCRKQVQRVSLGERTDIRVIRSCGFMPQHKRYDYEDEDDYTGDDRCFTRAGTFEVMVTYCSCSKDRCNAGSTFGTHLAAWLPLAAVLFFALRHLPTIQLSQESQ